MMRKRMSSSNHQVTTDNALKAMEPEEFHAVAVKYYETLLNKRPDITRVT